MPFAMNYTTEFYYLHLKLSSNLTFLRISAKAPQVRQAAFPHLRHQTPAARRLGVKP